MFTGTTPYQNHHLPYQKPSAQDKNSYYKGFILVGCCVPTNLGHCRAGIAAIGVIVCERITVVVGVVAQAADAVARYNLRLINIVVLLWFTQQIC
jgi:hypothetical protein